MLQLDCPDLAMERARFFQDAPLDRFLQMVELHVEAINQAIAGIPPDRVRLHFCWGNYDGPHTHDVPLEADAAAAVQGAGGRALAAAGNPRHQHEVKVLKRLRPPDPMLILPGVIDTTTNYVEHPEVVADRICRRRSEAVGAREPGDRLDRLRIRDLRRLRDGRAHSVVWAKLRALADGAALASRRLWGH